MDGGGVCLENKPINSCVDLKKIHVPDILVNGFLACLIIVSRS